MNATDAQYYRTAKGTHAHTDWFCANKHRSIMLGEPVAMTAEKAATMTPCAECCTAQDVARGAETAKAAESLMCPNSGVLNFRRIYSECSDCGKSGKVNPKTGTIRAHAKT